MTTKLEFKVFHAVGAVITKVTSHSKFSVLPILDGDHLVDFSDTKRVLHVNLDATPKTVGAPDPVTNTVTRWSDVRFDDRGVDKFGAELKTAVNAAPLSLGITTLGSPIVDKGRRDLTVGAFVGAVYIEHDLFLREKSALTRPGFPPWPEGFFKLHEITSIAYSENKIINERRAGRRYHGFHAEVVKVVDGGAAIEVVFPDPNKVAQALPRFVFRLDDLDECDRDPPPEALGGTQPLAADSQIGAQGALFLALPHAVNLLLSGPKLPIGQGS